MYTLRLLLCACLTTLAFPALGNECANNFSELDKTEKLKALKDVLPTSGHRGFVNETRGTYFFITTNDKGFTMSFFTTGLFDLYGVRRDGPLQFCDDGEKLNVIGLGRTQILFLEKDKLQFGARGPRQSFTVGEMPDALQKAHNFDIRSLASDPK